MDDISIQKLTGKYNRIHVITVRRDNNIVQTNLQENISIFNKIRHIQAIGNRKIRFSEKLLTPDHIGDVVMSPPRYDR